MYNSKDTAKLIAEQRKENSTDIVKFMLKAVHDKMIERSQVIISFSKSELSQLFDKVDEPKIGQIDTFFEKVASEGNYIYHRYEAKIGPQNSPNECWVEERFVFQIPEEILEEFE